MAQAVQDLFPEAKLGIGPPVENGFYYDFDVAEPFTPDDLKRIEKRMREIVKQGQRFRRRPVSDEEARQELAAEPYKLELIGLKGGAAEEESVEVGGAELTIYDNVDPKSGEVRWKDLCRGPHVPVHPGHPRLQADAQRRRLLARQREEPAAAAHLRHRVGVARSGRTSTCTCSRRPRSATTASSAPSSTCSPSRRRSAAASRSGTPRAASSAG